VQGDRWNLKIARFREDFTPLDETCSATLVSTSAVLIYVIWCDHGKFWLTLLTIHNITELIRFTQRIRTAILSDRLQLNLPTGSLPPQPKCNAKSTIHVILKTVLYRLKKDGSRTVVSKTAGSIFDP